MQSAATRNANARTAAIADSRVAPYAITPGIDSMSAHQRPSSSSPTTIGMDSTVILSIALSILPQCSPGFRHRSDGLGFHSLQQRFIHGFSLLRLSVPFQEICDRQREKPATAQPHAARGLVGFP